MTKDYNATLVDHYEDIKRRVSTGMLPLVARVPAIDKATGEYAVKQAEHYENKRAEALASGKSPNTVPIPYRDSGALDRYADLVLYEELKWSHPDKMTIVDYPIMSDSQTEEREEKYTPKPDLKYGDRRYQGRKKTHFTDDFGSPQVRNHKIVEPQDPTFESANKYAELYELLEKAHLTNRQRQVIDLVFFEDMKQEDAAEALGVSQPAIKKHIDAALRKLREVAGDAGML